MELSIKSLAKQMPALVALIFVSFAADAAIYTVNYTGKVDVTYLYGNAPLPQGIAVGSLVNGSFSFDTQNADPNPKYIFGSCSGTCGGGSTETFFAFQSKLAQSVEIAGHTWSATAGKVSLGDNFFTPGQELRSVGVDSGIDIYANPLISFAVSSINSPLFSDLNSIEFGRADTGFGIIRNDDFYISFSVDLPVQAAVSSVPVPGAIWLFGSVMFGFIGLKQLKRR